MARASDIRISASELDVMDVLWDVSPLGASDVVSRLSGQKNWSDRTVKTLLSRLVEKGALATQPEGRRYLYTPLISRADHARKATRSLSDRLFGGRAAPLVAHLAEGQGLSDDDIAELEALIAEMKK